MREAQIPHKYTYYKYEWIAVFLLTKFPRLDHRKYSSRFDVGLQENYENIAYRNLIWNEALKKIEDKDITTTGEHSSDWLDHPGI